MQCFFLNISFLLAFGNADQSETPLAAFRLAMFSGHETTSSRALAEQISSSKVLEGFYDAAFVGTAFSLKNGSVSKFLQFEQLIPIPLNSPVASFQYRTCLSRFWPFSVPLNDLLTGTPHPEENRSARKGVNLHTAEQWSWVKFGLPLNKLEVA